MTKITWTEELTPQSLAMTIESMKVRLSLVNENSADSVAKFFFRIHLENAQSNLTAATTAHGKNDIEAAWYFLVQASNSLGYFAGLGSLIYLNSSESAVAAVQAKNGSIGGNNRVTNIAKLRDDVAAALIKAARQEDWKKVEELDSRYLDVAKSVKGYNKSKRGESFREAIMRRKDMKRLLQSLSKLRR